MVTFFKENVNLSSFLSYFIVVFGFYLKQYLFQNNLKGTGLDPCQRLVPNLSPSLIFLAIRFCSSGSTQFGKFQNHTLWH